MFRRILFVILMLCHALPTFAVVYVTSGISISYVWVSDSTWKVSATVLQPCISPIYSTANQLCFRDTCSATYTSLGVGAYTTLLLPDGRPNGSPLIISCNNISTNCDSVVNSNSIGNFKEFLYEGIATMPHKCGRWSIGLRPPNGAFKRDTGITNIEKFHWYYVEALINYSDTNIKNNSAILINKYPIFASLNTPISRSLKATDIDGDSLVYHLVYSQDRLVLCPNVPATNIPFVSPYTLTEPFNTGATFVWDSVNAIISFTAPVVQNPLITLVIDEYRNGTWVGSTMHDIPIVIVPYSYALPQHSSLPASWQQTQMLGVDSFYTCAGNAMSFATLLHSSDSNAQLQCSSNVSTTIAGATLSYNNMYSDTVQAILNWIPTINDTGWHSFTITAKDTLCPIQGINSPQTFAIHIFVHPPANTTTNLNAISCGSYVWNTQSYTLSGVYTQTFANTNGCDSLVALNLSIINIDTTIAQLAFSLWSNTPGASYQWIYCGSNIPIAGATNQGYTTLVGGNYAVIINNGSCLDTSECITTFSISTDDYLTVNKIQIHPNPAADKLYINSLLNNTSTKKVLLIYDMVGQLVTKIELPNAQSYILDISAYKVGVYSLQFFVDGEMISRNKLSVAK